MQIVIEIPDSIYSALCSETYPIQDAYKIALCVKNGTPLPEHHGDLIDRKELKKKAYIVQDWTGDLSSIVEEFSIDNAPTIIPATKEGDGE